MRDERREPAAALCDLSLFTLTGSPIRNISGSICGASFPKTLAGPPERMIPRAPVARTCSGPK